MNYKILNIKYLVEIMKDVKIFCFFKNIDCYLLWRLLIELICEFHNRSSFGALKLVTTFNSS